jgi:uncharacterized protein YbbC (DUF1343 family)
VVCGVDRLSRSYSDFLGERRFVLISGGTNVDSSGTPVYRVAKKLAGDRMKSIWSLQHGFFVDSQDNMVLSGSFFWEDLQCEVKSLYSESLLPEEEWMEGVDALVVDIFDVGTRVYTFLNHVVSIMRHISGRGIDVVVLDRPNPLGGLRLEGNVSAEDYFSIVGCLPVPMRHGLTAAEFLSYALTFYGIDLNLEVVEAEGWHRREGFSGIWTYPSPNMPSLRTAALYPGAVLLEGTNLSEGRGTTRPFEWVGGPDLDHVALADALGRSFAGGVSFIPLFFKPEFSKHAGEVCRGLLVHPQDPLDFPSFSVFYEIIRMARHAFSPSFSWQTPPYEFEYVRPPIDMISGSDLIRRSIENDRPYWEIEDRIVSEIDSFRARVAPFLLY